MLTFNHMSSVLFGKWMENYNLSFSKGVIFDNDPEEEDFAVACLHSQDGWCWNVDPQDYGIYERTRLTIHTDRGRISAPRFLDDDQDFGDGFSVIHTDNKTIGGKIVKRTSLYWCEITNALIKSVWTQNRLTDVYPSAEDDFIQELAADEIVFWTEKVDRIELPRGWKLKSENPADLVF